MRTQTTWLSEVIDVQQVAVSAEEEKLMVTVVYTKRSTGERRQDLFTPAGTS
jgi:hypothetical protein